MAPMPPDWPALYEAGATLRQVATAAGRSWHAVRIELMARGVVLRQGGIERGAWYAEARSLRAEGHAFKAIARKFGVSSQAVQKAVRRPA